MDAPDRLKLKPTIGESQVDVETSRNEPEEWAMHSGIQVTTAVTVNNKIVWSFFSRIYFRIVIS